MSATEQLALIRQAGRDRRQDLQEIWDAQLGALSASILAMSAAQLNLGLDPGMPVEKLEEVGTDEPAPPTGGPDGKTD